ncbi:MBL fold metallo-hydrolase [Candidatus Eisenbacteria bacterium]|uniref:MBL fold metallo-hydrolase n=1 Tax=Eiseniibacteriota bacterium TaxID=2212470 RepID=A0ABV6YLZ1_UNCEI
MKQIRGPLALLIAALALLPSIALSALQVERQVTGAQTNCYLLYDPLSKDAVLFDVGGPIELLLSEISTRKLTLRYIVFTHGHPDHCIGLPAIRDSFPEAKICIHQKDFDNMKIFNKWAREFWPPELVAEWEEDPVMSKIVAFDESTFGIPDIYIKDGQRLTLGNLELVAIHSPGHSPGSVCFRVDGFLFSGDVLFKGNVGRVDLLDGSKDAQVRSVRNLYTLLPDSIRVYPGHGEETTIGYEKQNNKSITIDRVTF